MTTLWKSLIIEIEHGEQLTWWARSLRHVPWPAWVGKRMFLVISHDRSEQTVRIEPLLCGPGEDDPESPNSSRTYADGKISGEVFDYNRVETKPSWRRKGVAVAILSRAHCLLARQGQSATITGRTVPSQAVLDHLVRNHGWIDKQQSS